MQDMIGTQLRPQRPCSPAGIPGSRPSRSRLALVGDVHKQWSVRDEWALRKVLACDCCLMVGDFGEEDVELVGRIAQLDVKKAVILGNHDAW